MNQKIKNRIADLVTLVEKLNESGKEYIATLASLKEKAKTEQGEVQKVTLTECFALEQYIIVMSKDIDKAISKLSEAYNMSVLLGVELELSEAEQRIVDGYVNESKNLFVVFEGKCVSKEPELLNVMKQKALELKDAELITQYLKTI